MAPKNSKGGATRQKPKEEEREDSLQAVVGFQDDPSVGTNHDSEDRCLPTHMSEDLPHLLSSVLE